MQIFIGGLSQIELVAWRECGTKQGFIDSPKLKYLFFDCRNGCSHKNGFVC